MDIMRIALVGNTGVGKSTFVKILEQHSKLKEIRLAKPLYDAQSYIYQLCRTQKKYDVQDGVLLNFLGQHMRDINPDVMEKHFAEQLSEISKDIKLIICSDGRPIDTPFLKKYNFTLISIQTDEQVALNRRLKRGDLSVADAKHSTEKLIDAFKPDYVLTNNGTIGNYRNNILELIGKINDFNRQRDNESGGEGSNSHKAIYFR